MMFQKVLVANRGEIALRVLRTCRDLGLRTVSVFSDADADAPHVRYANEAVRLGPASAGESYLDIDRVLAAAQSVGADAIHPGYGFLAENAEFAQRVADAGITFIGPRPDTIRSMGDKASARDLLVARGVPVVPGYSGEDQSDARFVAAADEIGYPVLVKAVAGGGGKGMSVVTAAEALPEALARARRVAAGAFGNGNLLLEAYITAPRHIEVQILGDAHGRVLHCFERECSVQRRFQKIIEEAPSAAVDAEMRAKLCEAAVTAGEALGYLGAGTVEFIADQNGAFYFLEVNTRLQVEHPVTEMITGLDLVAWQVRVARGEPLPAQGAIERRGHAVECRIYAEDPANDFLPSTGLVLDWTPPCGDHIRVDSGVETGSDVGIHYDPMLAKVITWGEDRAEATQRMIGALGDLSVIGPTTNRAFLVDVLRHPAYGEGALSTGFLAEHFSEWALIVEPDAALRRVIAVALHEATRRGASRPVLPGVRPGWRNNRGAPIAADWTVDGAEALISVAYVRRGDNVFTVTVGDRSFHAAVLQWSDDHVVLELGDPGGDHPVRRRFRLIADGTARHVVDLDGVSKCVEAPRFPFTESEEEGAGCVAPMPGRVVSILVAEGDRVEKGTPMVILEAMKMEQSLTAAGPGTVASVRCAEGDLIEAGAVLVDVEADDD